MPDKVVQQSSLCNLCVLCVSVVKLLDHRRDAEDTEDTQRRILFVSERYEWIDFRRAARGEPTGEQGDENQERCDRDQR